VTLIIAHRGASADAPENSLEAFRLARQLGADGVELDVHASVDGVPVVHHDAVINDIPIASATVDEIRRMQTPSGQPIPTLAEALETLMDMAVFVEVKNFPREWDDALFAVLDNGPAPSNYQIHSFDHRIIVRLRAERDDFGYGVLAASYPISPLHAIREAGAIVLWQNESMIDRALVGAAHAEGYDVYAWTVDEERRMRELAEFGVDAICTNRPDRAKECV
jgi:glycerophosphoryl diester phosphodiesterase